MFAEQSTSGDAGRQRPGTPASAVGAVRITLLGEVALRREAADSTGAVPKLVPVPGARARLLVAALACHPGRSRSAQALIDDVWGAQPPRAPMNALHTQVSRLRSALPEGVLEIGPAGYRLLLREEQVDLTLARRLERHARELHADGADTAALTVVAQARSLWRGEPGAGLPDGQVAGELAELAATRWSALDELELSIREATGDLSGAVDIARRRATAAPLDEPAHTTLMRLLAAAGRGTEALDVFAALRHHLADQLGADPGPAASVLNTTILRGEPVETRIRTATSMARPGESGASAAEPQPDPIDLPAVSNGTGSPDARFRQPTALGLRAAPNPLLGRAADLGAIEDLVRSSRVTTVLGPGGTGKTRVANALGARLAGEMPVVLVELASVRADPEDPESARVEVEAAISAVLGVGETARDTKSLLPRRADTARERLREALSARALLLILDNCEHLVAAVAEVVADLIGSSERLTVVTTSRSPLEITAETVYPLPPLAIDHDGSPATELFATRARAVRPSIRLDPQAVARLCRTLDGLPLAIELAAARARTLSVEEIEARLTDRFALLRSGDRSSPARHRTLHAVIEWSWNLLDEPQRIALRRLCRFPAGFTGAAAEVVAGGDGVADVAAAVDGLVGQSLLTVVEDETGGTRYRMLETVREFGEEQLLAAGEADPVMRAMSVWAVDFSVRTARIFFSGRQVECVLAITADADNLVAVLRWAADHRDAATVYTIFPILGLTWAVRGAHMEIISWAPRLLELEPPSAGPPPLGDLQMLTLVLVGGHLLTLGDEIRGLARVRTWARRLRRSGAALDPLAQFYGDVMCVRPEVGPFGRLLCASARSRQRGVAAAALLLRASIKENAGDYTGSLRDTLRGIEFQVEEDVWGGAMVAQNLGQLRGQAGNYTAAAHHYRRAVEKLLLLRAYDESVEIRSYLAQALLGSGDLEGARRELEIASGYLDQGHSPDDPILEPSYRRAAVQAGWAESALAAGDVDTGLRRARAILPLLNWPGESGRRGPGELPSVCCVIGAHVLQGRESEIPGVASELVDVTLERLQQFQDLPQLGAVACAVGSYLLARDRDPVVGRELLALAPRVHGRQDVPSMLWERHRARHAGPELTEAVAAAAALSRRAAARRILALLKELDGKDFG